MQSENLRNLEIALCILRILRLCNTCAQSQDCVIYMRNLDIYMQTPNFSCTADSERSTV